MLLNFTCSQINHGFTKSGQFNCCEKHRGEVIIYLLALKTHTHVVYPCVSHCSSYFQAGGSPEHVIQLLSENYTAVAQTVNLLAEWLIQMGETQPRFLTTIKRNHDQYTQANTKWIYHRYVISSFCTGSPVSKGGD